MNDTGEIFREILLANEKSVKDLINGELVQLLLANLLLESPELEQKLSLIFQKIYLQIAGDLEEIFSLYLEQQNPPLRIPSEQLKTEIQTFVSRLVENKKEDLADKKYWLERLKTR